MTSSVVLFFTAVMIVCIDAQSTLQISNTYIPSQEPGYHFYYNGNTDEPKSQQQSGKENFAIGRYILVESDGSRRIIDTEAQRVYNDLVLKQTKSIFTSSHFTQSPQATYHEESNSGYPVPGRPVGPQFDPAPGLSLKSHRKIPGYESDKLPPGYVALVAKIDTPKGYKLLDEKY